jgi:uncharacterized phiE125 gp8 family phage protein
MYGLTVQTAAAADAVSLDEVKLNCRVARESTGFDPWFKDEIKAGTNFVQDQTGRQLINATFDLQLDYWPCGLEPMYLPRAPLSSVSSITYLDTDGASQTWASSKYRVITSTTPGKVTLGYQKNYPALYAVAGPITVRFVAGYGSADSAVPAQLKSAIKLYVLARWEERSLEDDKSFWSLIQAYRVPDEWLRYEREPYQSGY